jgi:Predicted secreted protein
MTLGTSLTSDQRQGTISALSSQINDSNYKTITVNGDTLVKYLNPSGSSFTSNSGVWSSALIQKTSSGSGINVKIVDYNGKNNITTITADQYRNAAVTLVSVMPTSM